MGLFERTTNENTIKDSKSLELQILELKAYVEGMKEYVQNSEHKNLHLGKAVTSFCRELLQREFALSQIGGSEENILDMDIPQLLDFTARKIMTQKTEQNKKILVTINENDEKERIIEDLENQITQILANKDLSTQEITELLLTRRDKDKVTDKYDESKGPINKENPQVVINNPLLGENKPIKKEGNNVLANIENTPKKEATSVTVIEIKDEDILGKKDLKKKEKVNSNKSKDKLQEPISHIIDLSQIINNMAEIHWKLIESIGVEGLSEKSDMVVFLSKYYVDIEIISLEQKVEMALNEMKISNVIIREKVNTGWRTFFVYSLSELGRRIFNECKKFEGEPILCERDLLVKMHSTSAHGYGIKDCANMLIELGYKDVTYDNKNNKIELPNGDIYVPDILAKDPVTGQKECFEYELVHHKQSDFDRKCNKMRKLTNHLHFIVPDIKRRSRLLLQVEDWRFNMKDKVKNVKVSVTTTRNLKKNMWDTEE